MSKLETHNLKSEDKSVKEFKYIGASDNQKQLIIGNWIPEAIGVSYKLLNDDFKEDYLYIPNVNK